ncbi:mitochondrial import inner membrane translocase subunit Tim13-like [Glandiceps talaboti]
MNMDSFSSPAGKAGPHEREALMDQVKSQLAVANAQDLLQKMSDKCFKKCIPKPGATLDSSEQKCLAMCMDRYMDAWNTVSKTYTTRLQRERGYSG